MQSVASMSLMNVRNIIFSPPPDKTIGVTNAADIYNWKEVVEDLPELGPIHQDKTVEAELLALFYGDITKIGGESNIAIVNAANITLRKGGGVSGSIHRAAGGKLEEACIAKKVDLKVTECIITDGFKLPAKKVIHAVTPSHAQDKELFQTYINAMKLAIESQVDTIIFPALSTGSHFFKPSTACQIALRAGLSFVKNPANRTLKIIYCAYEQPDLELYKKAFVEAFATSKENDKGWEVDIK